MNETNTSHCHDWTFIGLKEIDKLLFEMDSVKASISNIEHLARERLDTLT